MANDPDNEDIQAALNQLKVTFINKIPAKITEIKKAWQGLKSTPENDDDFQLLHRLTHTLAGTAATFKLEELAECAREIENTIQSFSSSSNSSLAISEIETLLESLNNTAEYTVTSPITAIEQIDAPKASIATSSFDITKNNLVYLVDVSTLNHRVTCKTAV